MILGNITRPNIFGINIIFSIVFVVPKPIGLSGRGNRNDFSSHSLIPNRCCILHMVVS